MMKYSTYTWDLVWTLESAPLPPARHQPHLLIPSAQTINHKKPKTPEMRFNSQQIVSYCLGLCTQNPGLREVDLEPIYLVDLEYFVTGLFHHYIIICLGLSTIFCFSFRDTNLSFGISLSFFELLLF